MSEQTALLKVQTTQIRDEHALRLANLRYQGRLLRGQRIAQTLRIGFQVFVGLAGTVVGASVVLFLHDAISSHQLIVDAFESPPTLLAQGLSGTVVAQGVLDELARLQDATHSSILEKRDLSNAWANEIKIEVPESGVSLTELSNFFKARFGHDVHIGGDLILSDAGGVELTVRATNVASKTFSSTSRNDIAKLQIEAAQYLFSEAMPVMWATYLCVPGHYKEAIEFASRRLASVAPTDRPYLLNVWGLALENSGAPPRDALRLFDAAIARKPGLWHAWANAEWTHVILGDEEGAWRLGEQMRLKAGGRPGSAPEYDYVTSDLLTMNLQAELAEITADSDVEQGFSTNGLAPGPVIAIIEAQLHDLTAAQVAIQSTRPDETDPTVAAGLHLVQAELALAAGDSRAALLEMEAFGESMKNPVVATQYSGTDCWIAPVEELNGHPDRADAVLTAAGSFVDCYRLRGDILDGRGDWPGARQWYEKATKLAPDLPSGYYSWGLALAKHGDLIGAEAKFRDANHHGPHWADPLKAWGDALAKQGRKKESLIKYDEALRYAPAWKELKESREAVKQGS